MSEWWTYTLSDFLLFSPRTYYRLFEIYNAAIWPVQIVAIGLGIAAAALSVSERAAVRGRLIAAILAGGWLWVAVAFHASRYATINWAAVYFAWAFGLEAALLVWMGVLRDRLRFERPADLATRAGLAIFFFALFVEPVVGLLLGRPWRQAEIFGVAPDPTAVGTLGILLLAAVRGRGMLMIVPVIWCAITGATQLAMKQPDAWIAPLAAVIAGMLAAYQWGARRRSGRIAGTASAGTAASGVRGSPGRRG